MIPRHVGRLLIALSSVVIALGVGACRDNADGDVPAALPEQIAPDALPSPPKLTLADRLPEAAGGAETAPVVLRLRGEPGTTRRYRLRLSQRLAHSGPGLPRGESQIEQTLDVTETIREQTADGLDFRVTIDDVELSFTPDVPDLVESARKALRGLAYVVRSDRRGTVRSVVPSVVPEELGNADRKAAFRTLVASLEQSPFLLPEGPVSPGARWETGPREVRIPIGARSTVPATVSTAYVLERIVDWHGRPHAAIRVHIDQKLTGRVQEAGSTADVLGAGRGEGLVLFDIDAGRVTESQFALGALQIMLVHTSTNSRHLLEQRQTLSLRRGPVPASDENGSEQGD